MRYGQYKIDITLAFGWCAAGPFRRPTITSSTTITACEQGMHSQRIERKRKVLLGCWAKQAWCACTWHSAIPDCPPTLLNFPAAKARMDHGRREPFSPCSSGVVRLHSPMAASVRMLHSAHRLRTRRGLEPLEARTAARTPLMICIRRNDDSCTVAHVCMRAWWSSITCTDFPPSLSIRCSKRRSPTANDDRLQ